MEEKLDVGTVVNGIVATIAENSRVVAIYLVLMTALGTSVNWGAVNFGPSLVEMTGASEVMLDYLGLSAGIAGAIFVIVVLIAQYLLWQAMLAQSNYLAAERRLRILAFIGLQIVVGLGTGIAFIFLIIPGLICTARWAAAPAYLIGGQMGVFEAAEKSWEDMRGSTTPVVLTFVAIWIAIFLVAAGATFAGSTEGLITDAGGTGLAVVLVTQFASHLQNVLLVALGVWIYGRFQGPKRELEEVFA